jgi:hypothetical protein
MSEMVRAETGRNPLFSNHRGEDISDLCRDANRNRRANWQNYPLSPHPRRRRMKMAAAARRAVTMNVSGWEAASNYRCAAERT